MLQTSAQAVDFKVGRHFGEGQVSESSTIRIRNSLMRDNIFCASDELERSAGRVGPRCGQFTLSYVSITSLHLIVHLMILKLLLACSIMASAPKPDFRSAQWLDYFRVATNRPKHGRCLGHAHRWVEGTTCRTNFQDVEVVTGDLFSEQRGNQDLPTVYAEVLLQGLKTSRGF
jgi:hypothetical protein